MVQHRPKCLLQVTNSSSQNPSHRMVSSFTNQTHHYQPPLTQKHMGTYSFNTHLNELLPCMEIQKSPLKHNHGTIVGSQTHHWKVDFPQMKNYAGCQNPDKKLISWVTFMSVEPPRVECKRPGASNSNRIELVHSFEILE